MKLKNLNSESRHFSIDCIKFLFVVFITSIILFSCNEQPTFVGETLLQDTVTLYALSTSTNDLVIGDTTFIFNINTVNKGVFHIGKANGITALTLVRFNEPLKQDNSDYDFFAFYDESKIVSCKIKLFPLRYTFGDSSNQNALSFGVYRVNSWWSNLTTYDSLAEGNIIDKSQEVGRFNGSILQKDTMDAIEFDLNKSVFLDWCKQWYSTKKGDTSIVWGLGFVADEGSTVIRQFAGISQKNTNVIELVVTYLDSTNNLDTLVVKEALDKPFYKIDYFDNKSITVQGATTLRSRLYFDVSLIPELSAIHSAQFEMTVKPDGCIWGNYGMDSTLYVELYPNGHTLDKDTSLKTYMAEKKENKFFIGSITSSVEYWNRNGGRGFLVFHPEGARNERWELDRLQFYGTNEPDSSKRPSLKIIYSRIRGK